jgi:hypothetical protein
MKVTTFYAALIALAMAGTASAQTEVDTFTIASTGDTARFWAQIPAVYSPLHPPAILIWWHQLGGSQYEMRSSSNFDTQANQRGWIAASHFGPNDRHWNADTAQAHCRAMLDWIAARYPFHRDSIYMIGGSMGGAAGQVWHNNNCGSGDYVIAATAGGSQILDCQLRQEQYLASGDTNHSMRAAFGGFPSEGDSVRWAYHRASAIHLADTTRSMHFNSLRLPVWNMWGAGAAESTAYGYPALVWDSLRRAGGADTTFAAASSVGGHGLGIMPTDTVCNWLAGFSANRYPDEISINADESGDYYWTSAVLEYSDTTFGRYGARKDSARRRLEFTLVRNIMSVNVDFTFPWATFDSLNCTVHMVQEQPEAIGLTLGFLPEPQELIIRSGDVPNWHYDPQTGSLNVIIMGDAEFTIIFQADDATERAPMIPAKLQIVRAYPNPFNSTVVLEIESPAAMVRDLVLFDLLGRVALSKSVVLSPGTQRVSLSAGALTSGTYLARLRGVTGAQRLVLVR